MYSVENAATPIVFFLSSRLCISQYSGQSGVPSSRMQESLTAIQFTRSPASSSRQRRLIGSSLWKIVLTQIMKADLPRLKTTRLSQRWILFLCVGLLIASSLSTSSITIRSGRNCQKRVPRMEAPLPLLWMQVPFVSSRRWLVQQSP